VLGPLGLDLGDDVGRKREHLAATLGDPYQPPGFAEADLRDVLRRIEVRHCCYGTQPGDPAQAAKAIIAAVESDEPPAFLLLGNDALSPYRRLTAARFDTIQPWEHLTTSTDIDV